MVLRKYKVLETNSHTYYYGVTKHNVVVFFKQRNHNTPIEQIKTIEFVEVVKKLEINTKVYK